MPALPALSDTCVQTGRYSYIVECKPATFHLPGDKNLAQDAVLFNSWMRQIIYITRRDTRAVQPKVISKIKGTAETELVKKTKQTKRITHTGNEMQKRNGKDGEMERKRPV